tara:strand:+ start:147 stop:458 length:312 start_codon:yes stop_codon:yes gene_type:complete
LVPLSLSALYLEKKSSFVLENDHLMDKHSGFGANQVFITEAEYEVLAGLALGLTAKEIAKVRRVSSRTIEQQVANVKMKLGRTKLSPIVLINILSNLRSSVTP